MSEPRPPIYPAPGEWPEVRDHHREIIERHREALRLVRAYIAGELLWPKESALATIDDVLKGAKE